LFVTFVLFKDFFVLLPQSRGWAVGTVFKVSDNIWFTARHVLDNCGKIFVYLGYGSDNQSLKLIEKVCVHITSNLAAFTFNNLTPSF